MFIKSNFFESSPIIEYVDIPALTKLTTIRKSAFAYCPNLVLSSMPDTIEIIESNAFKQVPGLTIKKLPAALVQLGTSAFQECLGLTELDINNT